MLISSRRSKQHPNVCNQLLIQTRLLVMWTAAMTQSMTRGQEVTTFRPWCCVSMPLHSNSLSTSE